MVPIVTFIGWHDCGKTTLASKVVAHLKDSGYSVAVIKSTKETEIVFDTPGTDTHTHRQSGADAVLLVAPDQMVMMSDNIGESITSLAHRYFPHVDIVIGEGFKHARHVAKIEVFRNSNQLLRDMVTGVIAVASNDQISGDYIFRLDEAKEIAAFIEKRFLKNSSRPNGNVTLLINGERVVMKGFVQDALAGTLEGFINSLKLRSTDNEARILDIRINLSKK